MYLHLSAMNVQQIRNELEFKAQIDDGEYRYWISHQSEIRSLNISNTAAACVGE